MDSSTLNDIRKSAVHVVSLNTFVYSQTHNIAYNVEGEISDMHFFRTEKVGTKYIATLRHQISILFAPEFLGEFTGLTIIVDGERTKIDKWGCPYILCREFIPFSEVQFEFECDNIDSVSFRAMCINISPYYYIQNELNHILLNSTPLCNGKELRYSDGNVRVFDKE